MLDIKFIRENKDIVALGAKKKHVDFDVEELIKVDDTRRELTTTLEKKRAEQNSFNDKISKATPEERSKLIEEMKVLKESMVKEDEDLKLALAQWQKLMLQVPNIPDMSVPDGVSDAENVEVKVWGEKPNFSFEPKDHVELMLALGMWPGRLM
jgi:seryl-tRNA synthetase